jgi:hypothetical protein
MAAAVKKTRIKKVTSVGRSTRTNPKNKAKKRSFKRYRGQGIP